MRRKFKLNYQDSVKFVPGNIRKLVPRYNDILSASKSHSSMPTGLLQALEYDPRSLAQLTAHQSVLPDLATKYAEFFSSEGVTLAPHPPPAVRSLNAANSRYRDSSRVAAVKYSYSMQSHNFSSQARSLMELDEICTAYQYEGNIFLTNICRCQKCIFSEKRAHSCCCRRFNNTQAPNPTRLARLLGPPPPAPPSIPRPQENLLNSQ